MAPPPVAWDVSGSGSANRRSARFGGRRRLVIFGVLVLVGLLVIGGGVAFAVANSQASPSVPATTSTTSGTTNTSRTAHPTYTVNLITSNTISATGSDGTAVTITVTTSTAITRAGQPATLSDITRGTHIRVTGKNDGSGNITAKRIDIILPSIAGTITAINGDTLAVQTAKGVHTVQITATTTIYDAQTHNPLAVSALRLGEYVHVAGVVNSNGSVAAYQITVGSGKSGSPSATPTNTATSE
jgi:hypothetical protein